MCLPNLPVCKQNKASFAISPWHPTHTRRIILQCPGRWLWLLALLCNYWRCFYILSLHRMNLQPDRPLLVMDLWWPVHVSRQEIGLYLRLPFPPLLLLCFGAEPFSSPVNFSVPVMPDLSVSMQRDANSGCAHFFPSHGFPPPLSVPLRPPGNSPKENSKTVKIVLTKYGLNERSGRVVWSSAAKKTGNGGARAGWR